MSQIEKRLERWKNSKQPVPKEEIESVLDHYFSGKWEFSGKGGSHNYKIIDERLSSNTDFAFGALTIPVRGGQKILQCYLLKIIKAIEIIKEIEI
jgi:hypothetical protein